MQKSIDECSYVNKNGRATTKRSKGTIIGSSIQGERGR